LLTAEAAEDIRQVQATMAIAEAWAQDMEIKMVADLAEAADVTTTGLTEAEAVVVDLLAEECQEEIQQFKTELEVQDMQVDMDLGQELQVEHQVQITAGHHGLEWAAEAVTEHTELQEAVAVVDLLVEEDLVAVALEDHKQLIILVEQAWTEQVQVEAEIITQVESVKREVLA
jgi:hypothetical protein